jgi:DNA-binding winged helix-turn-helix (wHTH) protein
MKPQPSAMPSPQRRTVFQAGPITYDEARQELRVNGVRQALETKPLSLLLALLLADGEVVSKRTLIAAAWGNAEHANEASLTTAMSKLRAALGRDERNVIELVHGVGYRIGRPVNIVSLDGARPAFAFVAGATVPGRPQWQLSQPLSLPPANDVWRAVHIKTGETRIFKFADTETRLDMLRREATLSRVLHRALGARDDLLRIAEWRFEEPPYFIESPDGGPNLPQWAHDHGGLGALDLGARIAMIGQVARTLAAAHEAGVLHGDIKPTNILVAPAPGGTPTLRLVDFGAGGLSDEARLRLVATTLLTGEDRGETPSAGKLSGTWTYMAPDRLAGGGPSMSADIYALGILLYQMVIGNFDKPLVVGWENDVTDLLLRQDIAAAAAGDPAQRLTSAATLAGRLEGLETRRAALARETAAAQAAGSLAREVERARARLPWITGAMLSLALGLSVAAFAEFQAVGERDAARDAAEQTQSVNNFLTHDLLGRGNPAESGKADETLMEAANASEAAIDRRLGREPLVAGAIYLALAQAFDSRSATDAARHAYTQAIGDFVKAGAAGEASAIIATLQQSVMESKSGQLGALARARELIANATPRMGALRTRRDEGQVWLLDAQASLQWLGGDAYASERMFARAADLADARPDVFDKAARLELRQHQAYALLRMGDWTQAGILLQALHTRQVADLGPRHPDTLGVEFNMTRLLLAKGEVAAALAARNRLLPDFVAVFGADHRMTLQLRSARADTMAALGQYDEAAAEDRRIYVITRARYGDRSTFAISALSDEAKVLCRAGHADTGLTASYAAYRGAVAAFGAATPMAKGLGVELAFCLIQDRQFQQARQYLDGKDWTAMAELTMDPDYASGIDVLKAAIALGTGDTAAGDALLNRVATVFDRPGAEPYMRQWVRTLIAQGVSAKPSLSGAMTSN